MSCSIFLQVFYDIASQCNVEIETEQLKIRRCQFFLESLFKDIYSLQFVIPSSLYDNLTILGHPKLFDKFRCYSIQLSGIQILLLVKF